MLLTQTDWLKMPARDLGSAFEHFNSPRPHDVGTSLLKKHKILPHPRAEPVHDVYQSPPSIRPQDLKLDTGIPSVVESDSSSPHTLKHASKRIGGLPPTPPTHSRQSSVGLPAIPSIFKQEAQPLRSPIGISSIPSTPPNQRSPPTPDVTPPRAMPLTFRPLLRPAAVDRYPSSTTRTDSFKTAPENPYSSSGEDDEDVSTVRPILRSTRVSSSTIPQVPDRSSRRKDIGLGLSLESEGASTPRQYEKSTQGEFVIFDGEWGSAAGDASEVEREWDDNLMRNVTVRKRRLKAPMRADGTTDEVTEHECVSPTNATKTVRTMPLQGRKSRHRLERVSADRTSIGKTTAKVVGPTEVVQSDSPTTKDVRRFSTMSGKSTGSTVVVDAMVIDMPVQQLKTLRHTKKLVGLRKFGSEQSTWSSAPTSVVSNDQPHLLVHKKGELPQRRHRSLASNTTVSTTSSSGQSRKAVLKNGGIPVAIIPERRSSVKSSRPPSLRSTNSRKTKRSMSLSSGPLSNSAKPDGTSYFDIQPRKRALSNSASSSQRTMDFPPVVPPRGSSLSAPTSRNTSRAGSMTAGSLTAESLTAHNLLQAQKHDHLRPKAVDKNLSVTPPELHREKGRPNIDHHGIPSYGSRNSAQATPFSHASYETNGTTAEVSEAMLVNFYSHQNTSLLVVQHENSPVESTSRGLNLLEIEKARNSVLQPAQPQPTMAINDEPTTGPVTPPQPSHPMDEVDSPLRNPREPPLPPVLKFIPPTPAGLSPGHEEDRQLGYDPNEVKPDPTDDKPKRGLSIVRKALSHRHQPESTAPAQTSLLRRTLSLTTKKKDTADGTTQTSKAEANPTSLYPTVADHPPDRAKLHPFWRPSHFWDDLEDHDSDYSDDDEYFSYPMIDNRPAPPKRSLSGTLKRTFAILPIQDQHQRESPVDRRTVRRTASGNMRVVKQRSQSTLQRRGASSPPTSRHHGSNLKEGDFGYGFQDGNQGKRGRGYLIPGLDVKVEYVGWGTMKRRLSERRRQQRIEKLRRTIGNPQSVQNGTDDVLRRRSQA